jgi:hypothetical protein
MSDKIIEEIREIRKELDKKYSENHDEFIKEWEKDKSKFNLNTVIGKPKLIKKTAA